MFNLLSATLDDSQRQLIESLKRHGAPTVVPESISREVDEKNEELKRKIGDMQGRIYGLETLAYELLGIRTNDGELFAECRSCNEYTPVECDVLDFDPCSHYCGGSPRCCP